MDNSKGALGKMFNKKKFKVTNFICKKCGSNCINVEPIDEKCMKCYMEENEQRDTNR